MNKYGEDIAGIRADINDLHISAAEIRVEVRWLKWLVCLLLAGLLLNPVIARFWAIFGL